MAGSDPLIEVTAALEEELQSVGRSVPKVDADAKVRGRAQYLEELQVRGMLHGKVVRSHVPHARILRIDLEEALRVPGVVGIVTGRELPFLHGESLCDEPFLARERVRFIGEAVAVIAALTREAAERARDLVRVEYEPLPAVFDPLEAASASAPLLHPELHRYRHAPGISPLPGTNICNHFQLRRGDAEAALQAAEYVFEDTFTTQMQQHCNLEPHGAICLVGDDDSITLWTNNDSPYRCRKELATALSLPLNRVTVISPPNIGGNFGGKGGLKAEACALAIAWKVRNRPVRVLYDRYEEFISLVRHPSVTRIRTGVARDGTLLARRVEMYLDTGAYAEKGPTVARFSGISAAGPYKIPHVSIDVYCVYTNKPVAGAMRGYGGPQAAWAYESQMDIIARRLGIDPVEYRLRHAYDEGDTHVNGQVLVSEGLKECLRRVAQAMGSSGASKEKGTWRRGRGVACMERAVKTPFASAAFVKVNEDGTVDVLSSTTDVGQGADTVLCQIAAEELGVPLERVRKGAPHTAYTPFDASTTSSRSTFHMGNAVKLAAADAREQILALAAPLLQRSPGELTIRRGEVVEKGREDSRGLAIAALLQRHYGPCGAVLGRGYYMPKMPEGPAEYYTRSMVHWLLGACGAEVEVDVETGQVRVLQLWGAYDAGRAIHPLNCQGQIQGGISMGLGMALSEEVTVRQGQVMNPSFLNYKLLSACDVPRIEPLIVEKPHPEGPFGAKGMGETTNVAVPPAIANAVFDAVGVRLHSLPLTPERILAALDRQKADRRRKKE